MHAVARKGPCPCGSGKRYKRCCFPKYDGLSIADLPPGTRLVDHQGQSFVAGEGITDEALDAAAEFFEQKRRGQGPAQQLVDFIQPLLDVTGDDKSAMNRAMSLGTLFWNLAVCKDESVRDEMLNDAVKVMETEEDQEQFRTLTQNMIERHRQMFPEMHS